MTYEAFDLAFASRNPVLILGDAIIGQMKEPITPREPKKVDPNEGGDWRLIGAPSSGKGKRDHRIIKSLFLMDGELAGQNMKLQAKYDAWKKLVDFETFEVKDAELVVVAYGSIGRIAKNAVRALRAKGKKVGLFRPKTLYPFPEKALEKLAKEGKRFLTIEHNLGQMVEDVRLSVRKHADSDLFCVYPGNMPSPDDFEAPILRALGRK
jgi:2-oxoglutarate ferredoxin oxidoreductase subunit alpha